MVRKDAVKISVGKRAGAHHVSRKKPTVYWLNTLKEQACVVGLKGSDPFVFGRGGEKCKPCIRPGLPTAMMPGITAALGLLLMPVFR